jgi:hypothetical protein
VVVPTSSATEALVTQLLAVISGDAPMADAERLLAPDVLCHMDRFTARGIDVWFDWLDFLRSKAHGPVRADVDHFVTHPDGRLTAHGCLWVAHVGKPGAQQNQATYRFDNGRIAEIWTTRDNYSAIFGAKVRHPLRWLSVLVEMALWRRLPSKRRTRSSRNVETAT